MTFTGFEELYRTNAWFGLRMAATPACLAVVGFALLLAPAAVTASLWFLVPATALCCQAACIAVPRLLWLQFEAPLTWEDVASNPVARTIVIVASNVATVAGFTLCVVVLRSKYTTGDLLSMTTVAEIGSTLFLVKQAQAAVGRPALLLGAALKRAAALRDAVDAPPFDD